MLKNWAKKTQQSAMGRRSVIWYSDATIPEYEVMLGLLLFYTHRLHSGMISIYVSIHSIKIAIFLGGAVTLIFLNHASFLHACQIKFDCTISPIFSLLFNGLSNSSAVLQTSCNVKTKEGAEPRNVVNNLLWVGYHDSWKQLCSAPASLLALVVLGYF